MVPGRKAIFLSGVVPKHHHLVNNNAALCCCCAHLLRPTGVCSSYCVPIPFWIAIISRHIHSRSPSLLLSIVIHRDIQLHLLIIVTHEAIGNSCQKNVKKFMSEARCQHFCNWSIMTFTCLVTYWDEYTCSTIHNS